MDIHLTTVISVSRKKKLDCEEMANYLSKCGIKTSITPNFTTQPDLEYGCRIIKSIHSKEEVSDLWYKLKKKYGFNCAHLKVNSKYEGCILDFIRPTSCGEDCVPK
jgi:hypothetical protein